MIRNPMKYGMLFCFVILSRAGFPESEFSRKPNDLYLIIYTTKSGFTGHVGIAVDNYKIIIKDTVINNTKSVEYDTVKNYSLTYYDLWGPSKIEWDEHNKNLPSRYYKLPRSSAEERITVDYFLTKGLPHSYDYPCDALIRIKTDASTDYKLKELAETIQQEKNYFNTREYNCTDYIILCLEGLFDIRLEAKEYIPFSMSSTPNQFYKEVISKLNVEIIKKAGPEINDSFFKERIINTVLFNQSTNHEKTN